MRVSVRFPRYFPEPVFHSTASRLVAHWARISCGALALLILWDASGLDLPLARLFGDSHGFALRGAFWLEVVFHQGARDFGWLLLAIIAVGSRFPKRFLRSLTPRERLGLWALPLVCLVAITLMKHGSATSCPWDLREFGGTLEHVSHWLPGATDGGSGHCFPAGHASTGFAFVAGFFVLARAYSRLAVWWLAVALLAGLVLGLTQQIRGAHFTSHTLWTAWICWTLGGLAHRALGFQASLAKTA